MALRIKASREVKLVTSFDKRGSEKEGVVRAGLLILCVRGLGELGMAMVT